jgi:phospholipid transport system transporter-binding protein
VLTLPSVVTHAQALDTARLLTAKVTSDAADVVLDASALTHFDSSVLAVMLACRRDATTAGKTFAVFGLPAKLGQLAALYGVADLLPAAV